MLIVEPWPWVKKKNLPCKILSILLYLYNICKIKYWETKLLWKRILVMRKRRNCCSCLVTVMAVLSHSGPKEQEDRGSGSLVHSSNSYTSNSLCKLLLQEANQSSTIGDRVAWIF